MATGAASSGIYSLPSEVREKIVLNLEETSDLFSVRLALRGASVHSRPRLFDRINLNLSIKALENAKNIATTYGMHVVMILIDPKKYEPYSQSTVPIYNAVRSRLTRPATRQQEHDAKSIANYYENEKLTVKILDSAQLGTQLLLALNRLRHVPRIVFTAKFIPKYTDTEWREVSVRTKS